MKSAALVLTMSLLMLVASCASPESRIERHRAAFDAWSPEVREKVRAGHIDLGFTPEMVRVALGDPERVFTRTTAQGVAEGWVYARRGPAFSFGLGFGGGHGATAMGGGVEFGDTFHGDEALRVIFENGRVAAIETRRH